MLHGNRRVTQHTSRFGKLQLFPLIGKQPYLIHFLQLADMLGYPRLGNMQLFRGPGKVHITAYR